MSFKPTSDKGDQLSAQNFLKINVKFLDILLDIDFFPLQLSMMIKMYLDNFGHNRLTAYRRVIAVIAILSSTFFLSRPTSTNLIVTGYKPDQIFILADIFKNIGLVYT